MRNGKVSVGDMQRPAASSTMVCEKVLMGFDVLATAGRKGSIETSLGASKTP